MPEPRVSVIIPTFDRAALVARAVDSVLTQTLTDHEVIVVDDGSTDDTQETLASIADPRLRVIGRERGGVSRARNAGIAAARGTIVAFLDSDDEAEPGWLDALAAPFGDASCAAACCGAIQSEADGSTRVRIPERDLGALFGNIAGLFIPGTFAIRRSVLEAIGPYDPAITWAENTELAVRLGARCTADGLHVATTDEPLVRLNRGPDRAGPGVGIVDAILRAHPERFRADPHARARFLAMAGVAAARAGNLSTARAYFRSAVRARPATAANHARLLIATVPPLARAVWPARIGTAVAPSPESGR